MNRVILVGRLTKDPDIRYMQTDNTPIARYSLAVDRQTKNKETDFINCIAFGKNAEFAEKYLNKGTKILVEGRIQTGSYTNKDGQKVYTTDIVIDRHEFVESRQSAQASTSQQQYNDGFVNEGFMNVDYGTEEGLPFN